MRCWPRPKRSGFPHNSRESCLDGSLETNILPSLIVFGEPSPESNPTHWSLYLSELLHTHTHTSLTQQTHNGGWHVVLAFSFFLFSQTRWIPSSGLQVPSDAHSYQVQTATIFGDVTFGACCIDDLGAGSDRGSVGSVGADWEIVGLGETTGTPASSDFCRFLGFKQHLLLGAL